MKGTAKRTGISLSLVIGGILLAGLVYAGVAIAFGVSCAKTDNLWVPIGVHAAYNAVTMLFGIFLVGI